MSFHHPGLHPLQFPGGMLTDKKPWHAALISSCADPVLHQQPAYGPLGALGVENPWVYGSLAFIAQPMR